MGNSPSKTSTAKKRRPNSFYGKKFKIKNLDEGKTSRRRSLPTTALTKEHNSIAPPAYEKYLLSISEDEFETDEHSMHLMTWGRNFMSPVEEMLKKEGAKVLDIGCGNGRWMLEVAAEFPHVNFVGIDTISTMSEIKTPHIEFQQAAFLEKLTFEENTFDFVHCRSLHTRLTARDWPVLINELVRVTKVGGYIELLEQDLAWLEQMSISKSIQKKIEFKPSPYISRALHGNPYNNQIFHEVRQEKIGILSGREGKLRLQQQILMLKDIKVQVLDSVGMSSEEYDEALDSIAKELLEGKYYTLAHRFWVRKKQ